MTNPQTPEANRSDQVIGRVTRVISHKTVTFIWCWISLELVQCVIPKEIDAHPPVGSIVAIKGQWQPYQGKREGFATEELIAEQVDILSRPEDTDAWLRQWAGPERRLALHARGVALAAVALLFQKKGFSRIETPLIVGSQATTGATEPFAVQADNEQAYLTVNNILGHHEYHRAGAGRIYQISRLFWAHRYSNRFSLNEFNLLEYSVTRGTRQQLIELTEEVIEAVRESVQHFNASGLGPVNSDSLHGLPILTFDEVVDRARAAGLPLTARGHVLPVAVDELIRSQLGSAGFWILDSPAEANPFYTRRSTRDGRRMGCSMELRLAGVPNVGAGSEWNVDVEEGRAAVSSWIDTRAGQRYINLLSRGLEPCTGFTLGLDRLLMYLLNVSDIRFLAPQPRSHNSFRHAPPSAKVDNGMRVEPEEHHLPPSPDSIRKASSAVTDACRWLEAKGYLPCTCSALAEPWSKAISAVMPPQVNYFHRSVPLITDRAPLHHKMLAEGIDRVYEIGPSFSNRPWWQPLWQVDVSWIETDLLNIRETALDFLKTIVNGLDEIKTEFADTVRGMSPDSLPKLNAGSPSYFINGYRGPDVEAFEWAYDGLTILRGGLWLWRESDLEGALGELAHEDTLSPLREFVRLAPPPAGGFSLILTNIPGVAWGPAIK